MDHSLYLDTGSLASYQQFLAIKQLPRYAFQGRTALVPEEYLGHIGMTPVQNWCQDFELPEHLFDYQRAITLLALRKRKFAIFAQPGLGKTACYLAWLANVVRQLPTDRCALICSPLMVIEQILAEAKRFHGSSLSIDWVRAAGLQNWLDSGTGRIGITNYESICEGLRPGRLGALVNDESSIFKSHYGAYGRRLLALSRGLDWVLCLTGTPAPNDRIEFANHAVMLGRFPTVNSFLARYFVNRGQTGERWELKPHALRAFYRSLSDWCIFLENPATYGWKDNVGNIPPIITHIHDVDLTPEQGALVCKLGGDMYGTPGGIGSRSKVARLAKGWFGKTSVPSNKPAFIRDLLATWPDESTIIWARYNDEQDFLARFLKIPSITGATPHEERMRIVGDFQAGRSRVMITKPTILGWGLNLQIATRQVFSTCQDSWEQFFQAVKRSNRVGSTRPLNVHIPVTSLERPMVQTVLDKAHRVEHDALEQEAIFKESML